MATLETSRRELDTILRQTLGSSNVYYQPPASVKMGVPCIRYQLNKLQDIRANNKFYNEFHEYQVIYITRSAEDPKIDELLALPLCRFDRTYISENLYHYVYTIYHK